MVKEAATELSAIRERSGYYFDRQMELLQKFSGIDCGTGDTEGNQRIVDLVLETLQPLPVQIEQHHGKNGISVIARLNPGNPNGSIILNSHLDTVFHRGDVQAHPFQVKDDYAYGLGIADCKGGFAVSAYATRIAWEAGLLPDREITMIYGCDEETGSFDARVLYQREAKRAKYAFVFEPARGNNGLVTKRKGCAEITVEVEGREAHAGLNYRGGADASLALAEKVVALSRKNEEDKGVIFNAGLLQSGKHADIVSDHSHAEVFVAFPTARDFNEISDWVSSWNGKDQTTDCQVNANIQTLFPPMERDEKNLQAYDVVNRAGKMLGLSLPEESSSGSSDACWFSGFGVPTVDALGPYMYDIHTVNERMKISTLRERTELFATVLATL